MEIAFSLLALAASFAGGKVRAAISALILLAAASAAAVPLEERLPTCLACHGETGQSNAPEIPSLGAQMSPYVLIQLYLFREKQRVNEIMNQMAHDLTDADLQTFADAIAKLPAPRSAGEPSDPAVMATGLSLVLRYRCNFCHNADLSGRDNVPRIAGQREDFLVKTMLEYKNNTRHGYDGSMAEVLQPISEGEIKDIAYFVSRQP
jgi:cytochrome c553